MRAAPKQMKPSRRTGAAAARYAECRLVFGTTTTLSALYNIKIAEEQMLFTVNKYMFHDVRTNQSTEYVEGNFPSNLT